MASPEPTRETIKKIGVCFLSSPFCIFSISLIANAVLIEQFPYHKNQPTALASAFARYADFISITPPRLPADHSPLYYLLLKVWMNLFGYEKFTLKLLSSILFSMGSVFVASWSYKLGFSRILSALFAICMSIHTTLVIEAGVNLQPYPLYFLLTFVSFSLYEEICSGENKKKHLLLFFLIHFLGVLTFYFHFIVCFSQICFLLLLHREKIAKHKTTFVLGLALILIYFIQKTPEIFFYRFYHRANHTYPAYKTTNALLRSVFGERSFFSQQVTIKYFFLSLIPIGAALSLKTNRAKFLPYVFILGLTVLTFVIGRHYFELQEVAFRYFIYSTVLQWFFVFYILTKIRPIFTPIILTVLTLIFSHAYYKTFVEFRYGEKVFRDLSPLVIEIDKSLSKTRSPLIIQSNTIRRYFLPVYESKKGGNLPKVLNEHKIKKYLKGKTYTLISSRDKIRTTQWIEKTFRNRGVDYKVTYQYELSLNGWFPDFYILSEVKIL